jgi:hypothetical protein
MKRKGIAIFKYFDEYGTDDFKILKIKQYLVYQEHKKDRKHLEAYEQLWINQIKCVNMCNPFNIKYLSSKLYRTNIKDKIIEKGKVYRSNNKLVIAHKKKMYAQKNRESISLKNKESFICVCGSTSTKVHKNRHELTQKHINFINSQIIV